jgi:hypothetical protein
MGKEQTMRSSSRVVAILVSTLAVSTAVLAIAAEMRQEEPAGLTVHEWGTFTSIAGDDGMAVTWEALGGPSDLPCFVHRFEYGAKANLSGTVRMETPVIYLYGPEASTVSVRVSFPDGFITEWYPKANRVAAYLGSGIPPKGPDVRRPRGNEPDSIRWPEVKLGPVSNPPDFPLEQPPSHYYAARSTDAAPLLAGDESEKFLFYRGVGQFQPPLAVRAGTGDWMIARSLGPEQIPAAILFANNDGRISWRVQGTIGAEVILEAPQAAAGIDALRGEMQRILVSQGLFPKEAKAMVATWGDSWFEEGTRLFYFLPTRAVDPILPLEIRPAPARVVRVFVGRMEIFTPGRKRAIRDAIAHGDSSPFAKYGRFLDPVFANLGPGPWTAQISRMRQEYLKRETACKSGW